MPVGGNTQKDNAFHKCLASFGTMAVPCFFMMSGALTLKTDKAIEFRDWIKKTFRKLIIPWILALLFYLVGVLGFSSYIQGGLILVLRSEVWQMLVILREDGIYGICMLSLRYICLYRFS